MNDKIVLHEYDCIWFRTGFNLHLLVEVSYDVQL